MGYSERRCCGGLPADPARSRQFFLHFIFSLHNFLSSNIYVKFFSPETFSFVSDAKKNLSESFFVLTVKIFSSIFLILFLKIFSSKFFS